MTKDSQLYDATKFLRNAIGKSNVSDRPYTVSESCLNEVTKKVFGMDGVYPSIVARPKSITQVQKILKYANKNKIFVFVRGSGTGYFGGEIPTRSGIIVETTALNKIKEFNRDIGYVVCEAGISVNALNSFLDSRGFFWPHNPGSRKWATIGGSLASLGVGTFSSRYGYATDSVLGMKVASPTGDVFELGSNSRHDMTFLNLIDLICSSEGTLGIIVETKLKISHLPKARKADLYFFKTMKEAVASASDIIESGIHPESLEIEDIARFTSEGLGPVVDLKDSRVQRIGLDQVHSVLFVNNAGSKEHVEFASSHVSKIALDNRGRKMRDEKLKNLYWKSKTEISSWASDKTSKSKVHTFVPALPLGSIPKFEEQYYEIARKYTKIAPLGIGYYIIIQNIECTASARTMLDETDQESIRQYESFVEDLASAVVRMGGTLASTFGLGTILVQIARRNATSPSWLALSKKLKNAMDPNRIMSPKKKC